MSCIYCYSSYAIFVIAGAGVIYVIKTSSLLDFKDYYYKFEQKICLKDNLVFFALPFVGLEIYFLTVIKSWEVQGNKLWKNDAWHKAQAATN